MCFDGITLSSYADGELTGTQTSSIKEHLRVCSKCRAKFDIYSSLMNNFKDSEEEK